MPVQIQLRRDTSANWASANPILGSGEVALSTDTQTIKVGNGTSTWSALPTSTLTLAHLAYSGLDQGADLIFGSGAATTGILDPSSSTNSTVIQANSAATLGVSRVDPSTSALSGISTAGAVSGDLLRYNTTNSRWEPITYSNFLTTVGQRTVQNIAFRHAGYFSDQNLQTIHKWAFPTDVYSTTTSAPGFPFGNAGFSNEYAGYFSNGSNQTPVWKWAFPAETVSTTSPAPAGLYYHGGFANPLVAGYFSRGNTLTTVYKWTFPADTVTTTTAAPDTLVGHAGFANRMVAGYFSRGGQIGSGSTVVYKWTFPTDAVTTTTAAPDTLKNNAGFANPSVAGYFSRSNTFTTVYKWAFPSDTVSTSTSAPAGMDLHAGFANSAVAGYFSQGNGNPTIYKWAFPTDSVTTTTNSSSSFAYHAGFANS